MINKPKLKGGAIGCWLACNTNLFPANRKRILLLIEMVEYDNKFKKSKELRESMRKIKKAILKRENSG